ncbi:MAG TPA: glycosyltransferase family 39 protein [Thermoanaerobaculia bacterium]|nr:glycosyltransferase family 39 protein [Thermoanaerobaculia bacterium]
MSDAARVPRAMWAVALLFFLEAAALALFVTPLWDVPDELVHYATIADIASGRGIPRPGESTVPPEAVARWNPRLAGQPVFNWAAIHPPGYHALAAPFYLAARAVTPDFERQIRLTRLFSALCGAAALVVLFLVMREAGADEPVALFAAAALALVPMYAHMASGLNHDILCALAGAAAALFWMRFLRTRSLRNALATALSLAAAGAVKATAVPLALALLVLLPVHLEGPWRRRLVRTAALVAVALSTTVLWAVWRGKVPGTDANPAVGAPRAATPSNLLRMLREAPLLDHTFKNFFGLIGWTGTGRGEVRWFQISGAYLGVYLAGAVLVAALTALWVYHRDFDAAAPPDAACRASWLLAAAIFVAVLAGLGPGSLTAWPKLAVYALLLAVLGLAPLRVWRRRGAPEDAVFTSQFAVAAFTAAYFFHVSRNALETGEVRGTHGRYFFVVLGFLLPAFVLPAADAVRGRSARNRALLLAALVLVADAAAFFALRVLPFYRGGEAAPLP